MTWEPTAEEQRAMSVIAHGVRKLDLAEDQLRLVSTDRMFVVTYDRGESEEYYGFFSSPDDAVSQYRALVGTSTEYHDAHLCQVIAEIVSGDDRPLDVSDDQRRLQTEPASAFEQEAPDDWEPPTEREAAAVLRWLNRVGGMPRVEVTPHLSDDEIDSLVRQFDVDSRDAEEER